VAEGRVRFGPIWKIILAKTLENRKTLTLTLSHPMGEGINTIAQHHESARLQKTRWAFSLSHRMGEGRGEGKRFFSPAQRFHGADPRAAKQEAAGQQSVRRLVL